MHDPITPTQTISRALLLVAPRTLAWHAAALPPIGSDQVLLRTIAGAVSVGSELPLYRSDHRGSAPISYPRMTGYESLALIEACGSDVRDLSVGDRVVAFYGHRTHAVVGSDRVIRVPTDISDQTALLAILSCDAAKGIAKLAIGSDQRVLISGAGTIGCLTLFNLKSRGIAHVDLIEPIASRRDYALRLGAHAAFDPTDQIADTYDAAIECSSRNAAFAQLQRSLTHGGRICVLADGNSEPLVLLPEFHERELLVVGSSDGLDYQHYAAWFFDLIRQHAPPLDQMYELHITADRLPQVFDQMMRASVPPRKVFVRYN